MTKVSIMSSLGVYMCKQIKEYTISASGYKLKVLNIGATITEYSLNGHNIVMSYEELEDYRTNELYAGCVVGRTAGRIPNAKVGDWNLPQNYHEVHNHHGNDLHLAFYDVTVSDNKVELTLTDLEGAYPGDAKIKVIYSLDENGLTQEIIANSNKPTLFNFTNHSYFNLNIGSKVLNHKLQIDCDQYVHLDQDMFCEEHKDVTNTAFDFRLEREIGSSFKLMDNGQFARTKFIDHPFKLVGSCAYSNADYKLEVNTDCDYVVVYAANYMSECEVKLRGSSSIDYGGICFETQKIPGDIKLVDDFYAKTNYKLLKLKD